MVEVTQADIAAARQLVGLPADASAIPHDPAVQAFARHRTEAIAALEEERDALAARVAELEGALDATQVWLKRFTGHVGRCNGGTGCCTCGRDDLLKAARKALHDPKEAG